MQRFLIMTMLWIIFIVILSVYFANTNSGKIETVSLCDSMLRIPPPYDIRLVELREKEFKTIEDVNLEARLYMNRNELWETQPRLKEVLAGRVIEDCYSFIEDLLYANNLSKAEVGKVFNEIKYINDVEDLKMIECDCDK